MNRNEWLERTRAMGVETWASEQGETPKPMPLYEVMGSYVMGNHPSTWDSWIKTYNFRLATTTELRQTFIYPECVNVYLNVDGSTGLLSITGLFHISDVWLDKSNEMLNVIVQARAEDCGFNIAGSFGFRRYVMYTE